MSDFFTRLIQAAYEPGAMMRPRPVAHFEQLPPALPFEPEPPGASTEEEIRPAGQTLKGPWAAFQSASFSEFSEADVRTIQEGEAAQEERFNVQTTARAPIARAPIDRVRVVKITSAFSERAEETAPPVEGQIKGQKLSESASIAPRQPSLHAVSPMVSASLAQDARNRLLVDAPDFRDDEVSTPAAKASPFPSPFASPTKKSSPLSVQGSLDAPTHTTRSDIDEPNRPIALRSHVLHSQRRGSESQAGAAAPASFVGAPPPQEPSQQAGPVIRVTIGRIVVKAEVASTSKNARPQQMQSSRPALSLTDYLNARDRLNARNGGGA
uniref:Uncharacterized protein n=1 Tax=Caldilinea aerophila TaxID=133453 RepID=A0A7C1FV21_9CHLR